MGLSSPFAAGIEAASPPSSALMIFRSRRFCFFSLFYAKSAWPQLRQKSNQRDCNTKSGKRKRSEQGESAWRYSERTRSPIPEENWGVQCSRSMSGCANGEWCCTVRRSRTQGDSKDTQHQRNRNTSVQNQTIYRLRGKLGDRQSRRKYIKIKREKS